VCTPRQSSRWRWLAVGLALGCITGFLAGLIAAAQTDALSQALDRVRAHRTPAQPHFDLLFQ